MARPGKSVGAESPQTAKQRLRAHIEESHSPARQPSSRLSMSELQAWHGLQHHRFSPNHYHEGVNLGPGTRPPGWKTGEGAVPKSAPFSSRSQTSLPISPSPKPAQAKVDLARQSLDRVRRVHTDALARGDTQTAAEQVRKVERAQELVKRREQEYRDRFGGEPK